MKSLDQIANPIITKLEAGTMASGVTTGGGLMLWLGANASAVGAIITMISLCVTVLFLFLNWRTTIRGQDINHKILKEKIINELKEKATPAQKKSLNKLLEE